ncbi:MAG: molybdopterin synthase sulfur carrier subunit [Cyanobacteria bacterium RYN_339]|nr:molybdopterin synthase sulfur carrier subunit [Cyanobacteria bacterium RYN_339]
MRVRIPSPLHSYTAGAGDVVADGQTLDELLADLDRQFPGLRFRIVDEQRRLRTHIRVFVDGSLAKGLERPVDAASEVMIVCALSGG